MADQNFSPGDWRFGNLFCNNLTVTGLILPSVPRSSIEQTVLAPYPIPLTEFRVWDALQTNLPGTATIGQDDLGLVATTYGADPPSIRTSDGKATTTTQRARVQRYVPAEYDAGQTLVLRFAAGMITTNTDGTATLDVEAWKVDDDNTLGAADLYAGAAADISDLTFANFDFALTSSGLVAGDLLDIRVTIAITDAATGTAVIGAFCKATLLCDIKG